MILIVWMTKMIIEMMMIDMIIDIMMIDMIIDLMMRILLKFVLYFLMFYFNFNECYPMISAPISEMRNCIKIVWFLR